MGRSMPIWLVSTGKRVDAHPVDHGVVFFTRAVDHDPRHAITSRCRPHGGHSDQQERRNCQQNNESSHNNPLFGMLPPPSTDQESWCPKRTLIRCLAQTGHARGIGPGSGSRFGCIRIGWR